MKVHVRDERTRRRRLISLGRGGLLRGHLPRVAEVLDPPLDDVGEGLQEARVDEGLLAHLPVLAVVLALGPRHAQVLQDQAEDVR